MHKRDVGTTSYLTPPAISLKRRELPIRRYVAASLRLTNNRISCINLIEQLYFELNPRGLSQIWRYQMIIFNLTSPEKAAGVWHSIFSIMMLGVITFVATTPKEASFLIPNQLSCRKCS